MPSFETRIRLLRAAYALAVVAAAGYLLSKQEPLLALVVGVAGLLRTRPWLVRWLTSRRALAGPWRRERVGLLEVEVPLGWTVELTNGGRGVQLDGPGALVELIVWPNPDASETAVVSTFLEELGKKVRLFGHRPCQGSVAGLSASGQRADVATASEAAVMEVVAARGVDGTLLVMSTYRDVGVPAALVQGCADGAALAHA